MARSGNYQITGNELQAMVNENLLLAKTSIPATNRCLTRQEVYNSVYVYNGDSPDGSFIPNSSWTINGVNYNGPSPNYTCNYNYLNPIRTSSVLFELNQEGNPYLNVDLFGYVNGATLRLDPNNGLDGMFFGGPQYSPQMNASVRVGNSVYVQANYGLNSSEGVASNYGWNAYGYGFLEVYANGSLISNQNIYKAESHSPNLQSLSYTFIAQPSTNYYVKAYSLVTYEYNGCYDSTPSTACSIQQQGGYPTYSGPCHCCTMTGFAGNPC